MLRLFRGKKPWPDLTKEPIETYEYGMELDGKKVIQEHAFFPNVTPNKADREGWMNELRYIVIADLEYSRRYPNRKLSKSIRQKFDFTDRLIYLYSKMGVNKEANKKYFDECVKNEIETGKKMPVIDVLELDKGSQKEFEEYAYNDDRIEKKFRKK